MKLFTAVLLCFLSHSALSIKPTSGIWFDPNESGRGTTIEIRNGVMLNTFFGYDVNGKATWWQGVARDPDNTGTYTGTYALAEGGQCASCSYTAPTAATSGNIGDFSITFLSDERITMVWEGGTNEYVKQNWAFAEPLDFAYGAFYMKAYGDFGSTIATMDYFAIEEGETGGQRFIKGYPHGSFMTDDDLYVITQEGEDDDGNPVIAIYDQQLFADVLWLVNVSSDRITGRVWIYESGGEPFGDGYYGVGSRMFDLIEMRKGEGDFLLGGGANKATPAPLTKAELAVLKTKAQDAIDSYDRNIDAPTDVIAIAKKLRAIKEDVSR